MSGHIPFSKLTANFSAERKAGIEEKIKKLKSEMALYGDLEIKARSGDREIKITNFDFCQD